MNLPFEFEVEDTASLENAAIAEKPQMQNDAPLYPSDQGQLGLDARRLLVRLHRGPLIDAKKNPGLWNELLKHESDLRVQLGNVFQELIIDRDLGVAFTREADTGDIDVPRLLRTSRLTFIDSVLLLHLRQLLNQSEAYDKRATVSLDDIKGHLQLFEPQDNKDRAGFLKRTQAAIEKAKKNSLLIKIRGSEERFEVSPVLKILFSADHIIRLQAIYKDLQHKLLPSEEETI